MYLGWRYHTFLLWKMDHSPPFDVIPGKVGQQTSLLTNLTVLVEPPTQPAYTFEQITNFKKNPSADSKLVL